MIEAFIGLGSNMGDRLALLGEAVDKIAREPGFNLRRTSLAYETEPVGPPQPRYLNAVVQIGTYLSPRSTLQKLLEIEEALGRLRREKWGPREIDLDLLLYGDRVSDNPTVPHPRMHERAFVLTPLAEIAPGALHPVLRKTARELLGGLLLVERAGVRPHRTIRRPLPEPEATEEEPGKP